MSKIMLLKGINPKEFTIQTWFKSPTSGTIFSNDSAQFSLHIQTNGSIKFSVKTGGVIVGIESVKTGLNDGEWHHLSAVYKPGNLEIYLNGEALVSQQVQSDFIPSEEFSGSLEAVKFWNEALNDDQIFAFFMDPPENGDFKTHVPEAVSAAKSTQKLHVKSSVARPGVLLPLSVSIVIQNDSDRILKKVKDLTENVYAQKFPESIAPREFVEVDLQGLTPMSSIACTVSYKNEYGTSIIHVIKSKDKFNSQVVCMDEEDLVSEVSTSSNTELHLRAELVIAESLVIVNMKNVYNFLRSIQGKISQDQIETDSGNLNDQVRYNKAAQIFNLRFQYRPFVIVYCKSELEAQLVYKQAIANNLAIRLRSGGHDHDGECSDTNVILIDFSRMNSVNLIEKNGSTYAHIGPGIRFKDLTTILAQGGVMIPHGTCATVGIAGFTLGGGWGPWTRLKGMCCESLVGAELILGNGDLLKLDVSDGEEIPDLLWALRGGGGMSYGIVTKLIIKTFPLPEELIKFEISWTNSPTYFVLKAWENAIAGENNIQLIGTNLKISAIPWDSDDYSNFDETCVIHPATMYGYWNGTEFELNKFIKESFSSVPGYRVQIDGIGGKLDDYGSNLMSSWDRMSFYNVQREAQGLKSKPLPPDLDQPAPHKITSRLLNSGGFSEAGYRALLMSLSSNLLSPKNNEQGLFTYITLGAISGKYYHSITPEASEASAFPYKKSLYTIQYQCWWNTKLSEKEKEQDNDVYLNTNRALDWMEVCRDFDIPDTSGAFISFKDNSIPTKTYFGASYERLKEIKIKCSKDPHNHFRTRKTII